MTLGHFPSCWKEASLVIFPKPNKNDYNSPKNYTNNNLTFSVTNSSSSNLLSYKLQFTKILSATNNNLSNINKFYSHRTQPGQEQFQLSNDEMHDKLLKLGDVNRECALAWRYTDDVLEKGIKRQRSPHWRSFYHYCSFSAHVILLY